MKGIISKEEELDEVLQQRHTKITVISETTKKLHGTKDTRNYSTTKSGVKIQEPNLERCYGYIKQ
jgi:Fe-S cluster assembly iron-binding protein IscA